MEQGLNSKLYWENDDINHTVSLVPTSAHSGEGVPDLLMMLITLTQERQVEKLMYMESVQCTVLEVKVVEGLGHTVDVVLVNGTLKVTLLFIYSFYTACHTFSLPSSLSITLSLSLPLTHHYHHHDC